MDGSKKEPDFTSREPQGGFISTDAPSGSEKACVCFFFYLITQ